MKLKAVFLGMGAFFLGEMITLALLKGTSLTCRIIDLIENAVVGIVVGCLIYLYWRYRVLLVQIKQIADLNHETRNSLQVLTYLKCEPEVAAAIQEATVRITRALQVISKTAEKAIKETPK